MDKVYKTSRIMAYVLAAIALLGIVPLVNGIVRDEISQKYNLDLDTQDYEVWQENSMVISCLRPSLLPWPSKSKRMEAMPAFARPLASCGIGP